MNQEQLLAQRDELVREHHLGELELYCTPKTFREWAIQAAVGGSIMLVALAFANIILIKQGGHVPLLFFVISPLLVACLTYVVYSLTSRTSVYAYTGGLVYLKPDGGRVVHWGEIRKMWRTPTRYSSYLNVELNDNTRIRFSFDSSRGSASDGALQRFIEEKIQQGGNGPR